MKEIEVKILEVDVKKIRRVLRKKGRFLKKVFQTNLFYASSFTKNKKITVRIRKEGKRNILTVKSGMKFKEGKKIREEYEIVVDDFVSLENIIVSLGFVRTKLAEMKREYWNLYGCSVEFCTLPKIPTYLEIEGSSKNIDRVSGLLGFSKKDFFTGFPQKHYGIDKKIIRF